uniref:MULE transposase domain-containing protein n=1 Tax=Lactuca sativa TaxID=4236 RepID=A0A9R1VD29_LACSA|nr:hypothetical protein LSAT_V11C600298830 [Lactuca sativa]
MVDTWQALFSKKWAALQEELQMDLELSISRTKLQTNNLGTIVKLEVCNEPNPDVETRIFKRMYICLGTLKLGFKSGKKELLGLDGCFLKGPHPGQILTPVGLDSNNVIYLLAYAVVEADTTSSWTWFLECLGGDLDLDASCNFTFGIILAIAKVFPNAEHRWCLRHIHENMKLQRRGDEFRDHLWRCATNTSIRHFERAMNEFKDFSAEAHEWLSKVPPVHWARSHFIGRAHSDCLLNNLCEVFNSKLEHGRDKPIITCLEYIRVYLMKRHGIVQKEINKCKMILTPTTTTILDTIKTAVSKYRALFCGSGKYQVTGMMFDQYVGRPNKKKRRAIDEPTNQSTNLSRKFLTVTCSKCHYKGHDSRTCKGQGGSSQRAVGGSSQGGVGRSSKDAGCGTSQGSVGGSSKAVVGGFLSKLGITSTTLWHIGLSTHPRNGQLRSFRAQDQNRLPGLRSVQDVTLTATLPHVQITILGRDESFDFSEMVA